MTNSIYVRQPFDGVLVGENTVEFSALPAAGGPTCPGPVGPPLALPAQIRPQPGTHPAAGYVRSPRTCAWRRWLWLNGTRIATAESRYDSPGYKILFWEWALLSDFTIWSRMTVNWDYTVRHIAPLPRVWQQRAYVTREGRKALCRGAITPDELLDAALADAGHFAPFEQPAEPVIITSDPYQKAEDEAAEFFGS